MSVLLTAFMTVFFIAVIAVAAGFSWIAITGEGHSPVPPHADGE